MVYAHRRECERLTAEARAQANAAIWEVAYVEGRQMTLEKAIAYALAPEPGVGGQSRDDVGHVSARSNARLDSP